MTTPAQRVVLEAIAEAGENFQPYGSQWPSVKRLVRAGLVERSDSSFTLRYRLTDAGREALA